MIDCFISKKRQGFPRRSLPGLRGASGWEAVPLHRASNYDVGEASSPWLFLSSIVTPGTVIIGGRRGREKREESGQTEESRRAGLCHRRIMTSLWESPFWERETESRIVGVFPPRQGKERRQLSLMLRSSSAPSLPPRRTLHVLSCGAPISDIQSVSVSRSHSAVTLCDCNGRRRKEGGGAAKRREICNARLPLGDLLEFHCYDFCEAA